MRSNTCSECGSTGKTYPYPYKTAEMVEHLCHDCYIDRVCLNICEEGFIDIDTNNVCCMLQPTGKKSSGWYGKNIETYYKINPNKCPKKLLNQLTKGD